MRPSVTALAVLVILGVAMPVASETFSRRSTELLRYECRQGTYLRDITLFANGTVRLREGIAEARTLMLAELKENELTDVLRRLRRVDLSETDASYESHLGEDFESCMIRVDIEGKGEIEEYRFGRLEVSTLAINQMIELAEDLGRRTRSLTETGNDLPLDYYPERGDVLRRFDGLLFEVLYFSADGLEVELEGVTQPMLLVVPIIDLGEVFDSIEPREAD